MKPETPVCTEQINQSAKIRTLMSVGCPQELKGNVSVCAGHCVDFKIGRKWFLSGTLLRILENMAFHNRCY